MCIQACPVSPHAMWHQPTSEASPGMSQPPPKKPDKYTVFTCRKITIILRSTSPYSKTSCPLTKWYVKLSKPPDAVFICKKIIFRSLRRCSQILSLPHWHSSTQDLPQKGYGAAQTDGQQGRCGEVLRWELECHSQVWHCWSLGIVLSDFFSDFGSSSGPLFVWYLGVSCCYI